VRRHNAGTDFPDVWTNATTCPRHQTTGLTRLTPQCPRAACSVSFFNPRQNLNGPCSTTGAPSELTPETHCLRGNALATIEIVVKVVMNRPTATGFGTAGSSSKRNERTSRETLQHALAVEPNDGVPSGPLRTSDADRAAQPGGEPLPIGHGAVGGPHTAKARGRRSFVKGRVGGNEQETRCPPSSRRSGTRFLGTGLRATRCTQYEQRLDVADVTRPDEHGFFTSVLRAAFGILGTTNIRAARPAEGGNDPAIYVDPAPGSNEANHQGHRGVNRYKRGRSCRDAGTAPTRRTRRPPRGKVDRVTSASGIRGGRRLARPLQARRDAVDIISAQLQISRHHGTQRRARGTPRTARKSSGAGRVASKNVPVNARN